MADNSSSNSNSKLLSSADFPSKIQGGPADMSASGPTRSGRKYAKVGQGPTNSPPLPNPAQFSPMNGGKSTYGVGGV